ncbi:hypothetical protein ACFX19_010786 [Malus domestica]
MCWLMIFLLVPLHMIFLLDTKMTAAFLPCHAVGFPFLLLRLLFSEIFCGNNCSQSDSCFLHVGENTDRLNDTISTGLTPWDLFWVPDSENSNRFLTEEKGLGVPDLELMVLPCAMDCVVLEYVGHVVGGNEGIVDSNELNIVPLKNNPKR